MRSGIKAPNRELLERLHRSMSGPFAAKEASKTLSMSVPRARRFLSYLHSRGWLSRVKQGLYTTVPLGATAPSEWREDPWVVVAKAYAPCYVAGWSACEHWSLTEQLFRDLVIVTARPVRSRRLEVQGTPLLVKQFPLARHFGTKTVWRDKTKVKVSDPSRTLIDVLDDPSLGGGIRHVASIVAAYFDSEHRNDSLLMDYVRRFGNRTVFKRLGFLIEAVEISASELIEECRSGMSKGLSLLDPSVSSDGRILKRWNLRVNARLSGMDRES